MTKLLESGSPAKGDAPILQPEDRGANSPMVQPYACHFRFIKERLVANPGPLSQAEQQSIPAI